MASKKSVAPVELQDNAPASTQPSLREMKSSLRRIMLSIDRINALMRKVANLQPQEPDSLSRSRQEP